MERRKLKGHKEKKETKLIMILFITDSKDSTRKFLKLINNFSNVEGYRINFHKSIVFLNTNKKHTEKEIMNK